MLPVRLVVAAVVIALGMGVGALVHARARDRRWLPGGGQVAVGALIALAAAWILLPSARWALPVRGVIGAAAVVLAIHAGSQVRLDRRRARGRGLVLAAGTTVLTTLTFLWWGADLETKYVAITASPALEKLIGVVRFANDLDRDGFGSVLGENDCAPFDRRIHPGAIDIPDDGIDQNCDGRDFSLALAGHAERPDRRGPGRVQAATWNILLHHDRHRPLRPHDVRRLRDRPQAARHDAAPRRAGDALDLVHVRATRRPPARWRRSRRS